jgi:hypothetical protein
MRLLLSFSSSWKMLVVLLIQKDQEIFLPTWVITIWIKSSSFHLFFFGKLASSLPLHTLFWVVYSSCPSPFYWESSISISLLVPSCSSLCLYHQRASFLVSEVCHRRVSSLKDFFITLTTVATGSDWTSRNELW